MDEQHSITPPAELVELWITEVWHEGTPVRVAASDLHIATQAARWGADQELEACCEWLVENCGRWDLPGALRADRRPKSLSLKQQALAVIENSEICDHLSTEHAAILRRALEQLND